MLLSAIMDIVMFNTMFSAVLDIVIKLIELVLNIVLESNTSMIVNIVAINIPLVLKV